jgi:pseudaminic acid cytidylyltransferase
MDRAVAIIPARGGSKRIPRKNIKDFHGKPLIAYSIETAIESNLFERVIVSTDDPEIASIAKEYGAEIYIRPKELADDYTATKPVVDNVLENINTKYDYCCTLYATAPLLQSKYLIEGFEKLKKSNAINAFSATTMPFPIQRTFKINKNGRCEMFTPEFYSARSQDLEEAYQDAGEFYWTKLGRTSDKIMFGEDSIPIILPRYLVQDIDTLEDWERAEIAYQILNQDRYDKWNSLKKSINSRKHKFYTKNTEIYFMSIGKNIGFESYGKDKLFLRPVLVYKRLSTNTFLGIPLTSKEKIGSYYFKFSYKKDKYSYASLNQLRVFDTKRIQYKSGNIKHEDFEKLKIQMKEFMNITSHPKKGGGCITSKKKQRSNINIVSKEDKNVK